MSFAAEMKDFLTAADTISRVRYNNSRRRIFEQENKLPPGAPDKELPPSSFPGKGGDIGTKDAPGSPQVSAGTNDIAWKGADKYQRALLNTIAGPESGGAYDARYPSTTFTGFDKHPQIRETIREGPHKGETSDAAGKYQFLSSTWNPIAKAYHLKDFSPESQDQGAWYLAVETYNRATGRDLHSDLQSGDDATLGNVAKVLSSQWASLPGGATPSTSGQTFASTFKSYLDQAPGDTKVAEGPATAIPEEDQQDQGDQPPPQEGSTEEGVAQGGDATISVPDVIEEPTQAAPQVEGSSFGNFFDLMFQEGGAIPDDTMNFAPGGKVDPWNPHRDVTQTIGAGKGYTPPAPARRITLQGQGGTGAPVPDWRSWGEGSPSQLKFRNRPVAPPPSPPPPPPAAPAFTPQYAYSTTRIMNRMNSNRGLPGGAQLLKQSGDIAKRYFAGQQITPDEMRFMQQNQFFVPIPKWKEGGMVRKHKFDVTGNEQNYDYTNRRGDRMLHRSHGGDEVEYLAGRRARPAETVFPPAPKQPKRVEAAAPPKKAAPPAKEPEKKPVITGGKQAQVPIPTQRPTKNLVGAPTGVLPYTYEEEDPNTGKSLPVTDEEGNPVIEAPEVRSSKEKLHKIGLVGLDYARGGAIPDDVEAEMRAHGGDRDAAVRRLNIRAGRGYSTAYHAPPKTKTSQKVRKAKPGRDQRKGPVKKRQGVPTSKPRPVESGAPNVPIPQPRPSPGNPWDDMNKYPPDAAAAPARQYPPGVSPATSDDFITIWDLLPDFSGPANQPYEQRKPEPTPRQPSPPVPYQQRKPEPTKSYDPDAEELAGAFLDIGARILQKIVPDQRAVDPNAPPAPHPGLQTRGPTWYDPTEPEPGGSPGTPYVEPAGGVRKVYARGGAIPDDTYPPPPAEGAGAPPSADPALTEAGPWGAPRGQSAQGFQPGQFTAAAERAAPGVQLGMSGINKFFGGIFDEEMGVPDEASAATKDAGLRRFAAGEGAATRDELKAIDISTGLDQVQMDEGTKNLERIDRTVQWYLQRGQKEKAEAVAASLLMYGAVEVKRSGMMAATALDSFQKTGDPQDLRNAKLAIQRAHSMIPDGINLTIDIDPKTRQIVATTIDDNGKSQSQVVDPGAIPGLLQQAMDGSAYWKAAFQIGQPRLAEQKLANEAAAGKAGSEHEWQLQFDEYKNKRELEEQLDKEDREAARKLFERQLDTEEGRTETERRDREMDSYFADWNDRLSAATTPEDKQKLFTEGLAFRYQNTRDRQSPIDSSMLGFNPDDPRSERYTGSDLSAVQQLASAIAQKNDALDAAGAMMVADALIMSPVVNNPDGTLNVGGYSLVFNPQLLPQLSALRKKYGQAESG